MNADAKPQRRPYHHGDLRQALLSAAEQILDEEGFQGLKLRAITRRVGVSHTAADPHFRDLAGLLSELAATGFERLREAMLETGGTSAGIGRGYIMFAVAHPQLFQLMFRSDLLDFAWPRLRKAADDAIAALSSAVGSSDAETAPLSLSDAARRASAWSLVHGLAMLIIDGRINGLIRRVEPPAAVGEMIAAVFRSVSPGNDTRFER